LATSEGDHAAIGEGENGLDDEVLVGATALCNSGERSRAVNDLKHRLLKRITGEGLPPGGSHDHIRHRGRKPVEEARPEDRPLGPSFEESVKVS